MGTVNIDLAEDLQLNLPLGQQLENAVTEVVFDFSSWQTAYGSGTIGLSVQRHGDAIPYAVVPTVSGTNATWEITETDTGKKGVGEVQVTYTVGDVVKKSVVYKFTVYRSLGEDGEYPSPGQTWQEGIEDDIDALEGDITDVKQDLSHVKTIWNKEQIALLEEWGKKVIYQDGTTGQDILNALISSLEANIDQDERVITVIQDGTELVITGIDNISTIVQSGTKLILV